MRILSGIQPSGALHVGNYFGMMRPAIELQDKGEAFYFIADYHSMTSLFDPAERRRNTLDVALDFLACGLDPKKAVFFRQSDVPEVTELAWMLTTLTPMGLLERAHSYKDKIAKGIAPNHGLFAYPVLMAADILIYDSNVVPVGRDQKQHVEMTRDIAIKFNEAYGQTLVLPEPLIRDEVAVVPGTDGQKMSKSYGNTIEIFGDEKVMRKKVMAIRMDSRTPEEPKPDADQNLAIQLLKLVAPAAVAKDFEDRLRAGGMGYGDLKKALFEHYWNYFAGPRKKRAELAANLDYVNQVLSAGAARRAVSRGRYWIGRSRRAGCCKVSGGGAASYGVRRVSEASRRFGIREAPGANAKAVSRFALPPHSKITVDTRRPLPQHPRTMFLNPSMTRPPVVALKRTMWRAIARGRGSRTS